MLVLVSKALPGLLKHWTPNLGVLVTPRARMSVGSLEAAGIPWACDNEAYSNWDEEAFLRMLNRIKPHQGCMWVALPDVVGSATETLINFYEWLPVVARTGKPIALVAQDGLVPSDVPWLEVDCLFIGGTTEWKLGPEVPPLVNEAKRQGKLVHMGRVNTYQRIKYAKALGCDSIDGTATSMFTDTHLPNHLERAAAPQQGIFVIGEDTP